jgi:hypothetical protein
MLQVSQEDIAEHIRQKEAAKNRVAASKLGGFGNQGKNPVPGSTLPSTPPAGAQQAGQAGRGIGGAKRPAPAAGGAQADGSKAEGGGGGVASGDEALAKMMALVPLSDLEKQLQAYTRRKVGT